MPSLLSLGSDPEDDDTHGTRYGSQRRHRKRDGVRTLRRSYNHLTVTKANENLEADTLIHRRALVSNGKATGGVAIPPFNRDTMTNVTTPIRAAFEMQRQSTRQNQRFLELGLEIQRSAAQTFLRNGLAAQRSVQEQGIEFAREAADAQLEAFGAFEESGDEAWDDFEAEFLAAVDELGEQQRAVLAESVEAFLDANRNAERETVEGVQAASSAARTVRQQTEAVSRTAQQSAEDAADETAEAAEQQAELQAEVVDESLDNLVALEELGSTHADRLRERDIESTDDLAEADVAAVAAAADVSEAQAEAWIEAAQPRS